MAGCKLKDFNELVPDMMQGMNNEAKRYLRHIVGYMFRDLEELKTSYAVNRRIAERARRFKNVVRRLTRVPREISKEVPE